MDNRYEIKKYDQKDFPLSTYLEYAHTQEREREEIHLKDYLNVILKRKSIVMVFLIAVVILTIVLSLMMTPIYMATTVVRIDKESPNILSFKAVQIDSPGADYYQTQFEILKSRNMAERIIRNLNLTGNQDFLPPKDTLSKIKSFMYDNTIGVFSDIFLLFSPRKSPDTAPSAPANRQSSGSDIPEYLISSLISRLEVSPVKNSQLVKVSFVSQNPEISMNVANAVAQTYITFDLESRLFASQDAKEFLQSQIELIRLKVEEAEQALNKYAAKNEIIFNTSNNSLYAQKLSDISAALNGVTTERIQKEALFREVRESGSNNPIILNNSMIQGLRKEHATLEAEYYNLLKIYTPNYPKMKSLQSQMDAITNRISQETAKIVNATELDYRNSFKKEENLTRALNSQKQKVLAFQDSAAQYEVLKREVDVNKGLYNSLLQRLNEVSVSASNKATNIQVLDKAILPKYPFKPNLPFNIVLAIIFGLTGGIGIAFMVEYFDNSIKDTDDIEKKADLPILGVIPHVEEVREAVASSNNTMIQHKVEPQQSDLPMVVDHTQTNPVIEAFRSIGAFILLSSSEKPPKTILITGPVDKIGKTSVAINIAKAMREKLGRGVLIDADLRRPRLHSAFALDNTVGLSSVLSGNIEFNSSNGRLIKSSGISGLSIITSGPIPPNPSELLGSPKIQAIIYALQSMYEFIIIDSPPVMGLPDSIYLSRVVDGTVLVVRAGETPLKVLKETKRLFRDINAKILGVVLNGVKQSDLKYGAYNYYHSAYYSSYFENQKH
ncbi:MAG: polysaccharide biosynthesis tyrosine autokinase [Thermodesulfovibrionales bacterium]|nr:polysaccharide biosynthesis tyrosine autokinase [Thermodesulfovibrionales bacterium]